MSKITSNPEKHYLAVKVSGDTDEDVLRATAAELFAEGYVKESYSDAIIEREKKYPTGLPTGEICVAIPHTDPEHVNDAAICLSILEKPVISNLFGSISSKSLKLPKSFGNLIPSALSSLTYSAASKTSTSPLK